MRYFIRIFLGLVSMFLATLAFSIPPKTINYQGYLTNAVGTAINVPVNITLRLYLPDGPDVYS